MRWADLKLQIFLHLLLWTLVPYLGFESFDRQLRSTKQLRAFYYLKLTWLCFDIVAGPVFFLTEAKPKQDALRATQQPRKRGGL